MNIFNFRKFSYDTLTDEINQVDSFSKNSPLNFTFSMDYNPTDGQFYILGASDTGNSSQRSLYIYNIDDDEDNSSLTLIDTIISTSGHRELFDMTFDKDGNLYFLFSNGEIEIYNLATKTISNFSNTGFDFTRSLPGLSYDFDNDRLIYSHSNSLFTTNVKTGVNNQLFSFSTNCSTEGIEYVGNNKLLVTSLGDNCNEIYTLDLTTQQTEVILDSRNISNTIDLVYIPNVPIDNCNGAPLSLSINKSTFTCNDLGKNTITIIASDNDGNTTSCESTITIIDRIAPQIEVLENFTLELDDFGLGSIDLNDILISSNDNCNDDISYEISKTNFECSEIGTDNSENELIKNGSFEDDLTDWQVIINPSNLSTSSSCTTP